MGRSELVRIPHRGFQAIDSAVLTIRRYSAMIVACGTFPFVPDGRIRNGVKANDSVDQRPPEIGSRRNNGRRSQRHLFKSADSGHRHRRRKRRERFVRRIGKNAEIVSGLVDFPNARPYVNRSDNLERQIFTVAHELGHWLLHKDIYESDPERYNVLPRFSNPFRDGPLEQEANRFAASLLVPKRLLVPVLHAPVSTLSEIFLVNRALMERRIKDVRK